jgi:hypothetical protein
VKRYLEHQGDEGCDQSEARLARPGSESLPARDDEPDEGEQDGDDRDVGKAELLEVSGGSFGYRCVR